MIKLVLGGSWKLRKLLSLDVRWMNVIKGLYEFLGGLVELDWCFILSI